MIAFCGTDTYRNGVFEYLDWSAPLYERPDEIFEAFQRANVFGKKLVAIQAVGAAENLKQSELLRKLRMKQYAAGISEDDRQRSGCRFDAETYLPCEALLCEPVQFIFDDHTTLELLPMDNGGLRMGKNSIPRDMADGLNHSNFDASILFHALIGQELYAVAIERTETVIQRSPGNSANESRCACALRMMFHGLKYLLLEVGYGHQYHMKLMGTLKWQVPMRYTNILQAVRPVRQILMHEGSGMLFDVFCCCPDAQEPSQIEWQREGSFSLEEAEVLGCLYPFLRKHLDIELNQRYRPPYDDSSFDGYGDNLYTYTTVGTMLAEIRSVADALESGKTYPPDSMEGRYLEEVTKDLHQGAAEDRRVIARVETGFAEA